MKYKLILHNDGAVVTVFPSIDKAEVHGDDLIITTGMEQEHMTGVKPSLLLLPDTVDVGDTIPQDIIDQGLPIDRVKSEKEEVDEIKGQLDTAIHLLNEMSRQFIRSDAMTDEQRGALINQFFPVKVGDTVHPGEVVRIEGRLYEMIQPNPVTIHDEAWLTDPSIFADFINPPTEEGEVVVEEFKQPAGAHDAYEIGDVVLFNGAMYESVIDGNVWSPVDNPAGWSIIEE